MDALLLCHKLAYRPGTVVEGTRPVNHTTCNVNAIPKSQKRFSWRWFLEAFLVMVLAPRKTCHHGT